MQVQFEILSGKYEVPSLLKVRDLSTGIEGRLYLCHVGQIQEDLLQEADWVASCFLPKELAGKSPFGQSIIRPEKVQADVRKNIITLTLKDYFQGDFDFEPYAEYPESTIRDSAGFHNFGSSVVRAWIRLDSVDDIKTKVRTMIEDFPEHLAMYKPYLIYALYVRNMIPSRFEHSESNFYYMLGMKFDIYP